MTITEFLEARIAEDEAGAINRVVLRCEDRRSLSMDDAERAHAECAAKRAIIAEHVPVDYSGLGMESPNACARCGADLNMSDWEWAHDSFPCPTLRAVAAIYADHPEYQQEWTP